MDPIIATAAKALAQGKPLDALNFVALRGDAPGLALRGIAMAQLGDLVRAKGLLKRAARAFGPKRAVSRARCRVAEAEIALVSRDLSWPAETLTSAWQTLEHHGDSINAAHARHLEIRRLLLIGRLDDAEHALCSVNPAGFPPALKTAHELVIAGIAIRRLQTDTARAALARARSSAGQAGIPSLAAEVESTQGLLTSPAARLMSRGTQRLLLLEDVEALVASKTLIVDACRYAVRNQSSTISLTTRPVLFTLARTLAEAWPHDVSRDTLIAQAFRLKGGDDSHRARLRVEIGRLRKAINPLAGIKATPTGFIIEPHQNIDVAVLARPINERHGALLALLADGDSWPSSALAVALGVSQRTVQRALDALAEAGKVQSFGQGRARCWMATPVPGFTTTLLLPGLLPDG
ncbi:MAG: helix-turn-helix domain-containing protein [Alteromonadaceae bacterium]|nr:helix-turn-helix domain-containing protein [Alteromonadaceae bacterium]MBH84981.1 helix-turn-helix domain-containing protein [Alteromonadaceae bacterium]|tara:strand:+ start:23242 stop:24462 length:1221 start_codon:yes stop_codon:yes gene_type:complete